MLIEEKIDLEVRSLDTCMFDQKTFSDILSRVQKAVDDLNLHSYSNLPIWVNKLDIEVRRSKEKAETQQLLFSSVRSVLSAIKLRFGVRLNASWECVFRLV